MYLYNEVLHPDIHGISNININQKNFNQKVNSNM